MKTRDIVIDADHILFNVAFNNQAKDGLSGKPLGKEKLKPYKDHFKQIIDDYITIAEVESICYKWKIGKVRVILSDHRNFRYDVYPEYKAGRPEKKGIMKRLKKWAMKKYHFEPNTEADDVVAYYVRKGGIGFTTDKDLFNGVEGLWFNTHYKHRCWVRTTKAEAEYFFKQQVLAGDLGDGIPSINGVGLPTADKLMQKHGSSWGDIVKIFKMKGYDKDYMITMARLVCMSQWSPKKGVVLWETDVEKRKRKKLKMQNWSLHKKIKHAEKRIKEFYVEVDGKVFVSFSGGKDSVVLRHLVLSLYPDTPCVFSNTTNEYPETLQFIKSLPDVIWVHPKKTFTQILVEDGFPLVSKKVSRGMRTLKNPTDKNAGAINLLLTGITTAGHNAPSYKMAKKWLFLKDEPFDITDKCCDILKKRPLKIYQKEAGRFPFIGTQASESNQRGWDWVNYGCNIVTEKTHKSRPLSIWNETDIWEYINKFNLPYSKIYDDVIDEETGEVLVCGEVRTGCAYCGFGANLEKGNTNRFQRLAIRKPKQFKKIMNIENNGVRFEDALNKVEVKTT